MTLEEAEIFLKKKYNLQKLHVSYGPKATAESLIKFMDDFMSMPLKESKPPIAVVEK